MYRIIPLTGEIKIAGYAGNEDIRRHCNTIIPAMYVTAWIWPYETLFFRANLFVRTGAMFLQNCPPAGTKE